MIKGRVDPPKCLLHVVTQIEKDRYSYSNKTINTNGLVRNWHLL